MFSVRIEIIRICIKNTWIKIRAELKESEWVSELNSDKSILAISQCKCREFHRVEAIPYAFFVLGSLNFRFGTISVRSIWLTFSHCILYFFFFWCCCCCSFCCSAYCMHFTMKGYQLVLKSIHRTGRVSTHTCCRVYCCTYITRPVFIHTLNAQHSYCIIFT